MNRYVRNYSESSSDEGSAVETHRVGHSYSDENILAHSTAPEYGNHPKHMHDRGDMLMTHLLPESDSSGRVPPNYETEDFTSPDMDRHRSRDPDRLQYARGDADTRHEIRAGNRSKRKRDKKRGSPRPSFGTNSSISSIPPKEGPSGVEVVEVYAELQEINGRLKREFHILHDKDMMLKEKEKSLNAAHEDFEIRVEEEVRRRVSQKEKEYKYTMEMTDQQLREKTKESKRLKENFDTLKTANDALRKELESLQSQHDKLEKQASSLQARLTNLQRKHEHAQRKEEEGLSSDFQKPSKQRKDPLEGKILKIQPKVCGNTMEVVALLVEWVSDIHLKPAISEGPTKPLDTFYTPDFINERCLKVIPSVVELIKDSSQNSTQFWLSLLQFIYWSILHLEANTGQQKLGLSSTLRRLGEHLYSPRPLRVVDSETKGNKPEPEKSRKDGLFFKSCNQHMKFLSSLIVLRTLAQVDHLAHVMEVLRNDLKEDQAKQLFLHYQVTTLLLPFVKPTNKTLLNWTIDLYLQMSTESSSLQPFLESCSTEGWFRSISMVMRMPSVEEKVVEKLSIILQKLSKLKCNRRYFEVFGMTTSLQEMLTSHNKDNAFLTLNLRSILFNLNIKQSS